MNDLAEIVSHVFLGNDLRSWAIAAIQFAVWFTVLPLVRAIVTRPGAPSRAGEVDDVAAVLRDWYPDVARIVMPGTVDGGDVCDAGGHFLIGLSARTNEEGARQLTGLLGELGYRSSLIDIRGSLRLLHLKTGLGHLGDGRLVISADLPRVAARLHALGYQTVPLEMSEFRKMDGGLSCLSLLLGERTRAGSAT